MSYIQKDFSTTQYANHVHHLPCDHTDCKSEIRKKDLLFFAFSVEENTDIWVDRWQNIYVQMHLYVHLLSIFISLSIYIKIMCTEIFFLVQGEGLQCQQGRGHVDEIRNQSHLMVIWVVVTDQPGHFLEGCIITTLIIKNSIYGHIT